MIFREVLNSDLPPEEKTIDRLWHDGQTFNIAGAETTAWALGVITYYLLSEPEILRRLQEELTSVVKDGKVEETSTAELEQLPYLVSRVKRRMRHVADEKQTAVIKEGLRLSFGVAGRLYRISPDKAQIFKDGKKDWVIPSGVRSFPSFLLPSSFVSSSHHKTNSPTDTNSNDNSSPPPKPYHLPFAEIF